MRCRSCASERTEMVLDLGNQPHCNALVEPGQPDPPSYPLRLWFCHDCTLVQIDHTIPKEEMFADYPYVSGTTKTLVRHFRKSAERLCNAYLLPGDLVVDIGSNDGTWLEQYPDSIRVLGVEPSNLADTAKARTLKAFFDDDVADKILGLHGSAELITAAGVFFHLEDLHSVVKGIEALLSPSGVLVVQAIYLGAMVKNGTFDQIYHEHLCYYTLASLESLFAQHGMTVFAVEMLPIHGGTIEVHVCRDGARAEQPSVAALRYMERRRDLGKVETYRRFAERAEITITDIRDALEECHDCGLTTYAYGAPAKGATLLNVLQSTGHVYPNLVQRAVEKNPAKFGKVMPGSRLPIIDEATIAKPDVYLLLAWNFMDEIFKKERDFLAKGGRFLVPFPQVRMVP